MKTLSKLGALTVVTDLVTMVAIVTDLVTRVAI